MLKLTQWILFTEQILCVNPMCNIIISLYIYIYMKDSREKKMYIYAYVQDTYYIG